MNTQTTIKKGNLSAMVYNGRLCSICLNGTEYMHGANKPAERKTEDDWKGWGQSEIVMFPVIGPVNDYQVKINGDSHFLDQDGISKLLGFHTETPTTRESVDLVQKHDGQTILYNIKHDEDNSRPQWLSYPYNFEIEKRLIATPGRLTAEFAVTNNSAKEMNYMFGWHPAFKMLGEAEFGEFICGDHKISLESVIEASKRHKEIILPAGQIKYTNKQTEKGLMLSCIGFKHYMLGSPGESMFCIKPLSHKPEPEQDYFDGKKFEVLGQTDTKRYFVMIEPFQ